MSLKKYIKKEHSENINLILGDCLEKLKEMEENSVDSIVTDPPYGISFMNNKWDCNVPSVEIWKECLRVLKPGGHLLCFSGTRTQHRMAVNIEDAGFEIRDMIAWVYSTGFPKSLNVEKEITKKGIDSSNYQGLGTNLKPALEPITLARKPISEKTITNNILKFDTGALNINDCRVPLNGDKPYNYPNGRGGSSWGNMDSLKTNLNTPIKGNDNGRFPSNLIHDGSKEVLTNFPDTGKSGIAVQRNGGGQKIGGNGIYSGSKGLTREDVGYNDSGSSSRFFYCAKASEKDRGEENTHPTVKPQKLMEYLCQLITPKNGIVLDPFMGSGSTGKAALNKNFGFVGIEKEQEYFDIAKNRINITEVK